MKRKFYVVPILLAVFVWNCSKDSQELATFDGGSVTRFEMLKTLELMQRGRKQNEPISAEIQAKILENIAIQKMIYESMRQTGRLKETEIVTMTDFLSPVLKSNLYFENYAKTIVKNSPLEFAVLEIMILRRPAVGDLKEIATNHLTTLNSLGSNKAKSEYISENTEETSRKAISGLTEPLCTNCGPSQFQEILDIAGSAKGSDFVLYLPPGMEEVAYIVRKVDTERVHPERLGLYFTRIFTKFQKLAKQYFENKGIDPSKPENREIGYYADGDPKEKGEQYGGFSFRQFERYAMDLEKKRIEDEAQISYEQPPELGSKDADLSKVFPPETVLVRFKSEPYKMADLLQLYNSLPPAILPPVTSESAKIQEALKFFSQTVIQSLTGKNSPTIQKVSESKDYHFNIATNLQALAINIWIKDLNKDPIVVSEQQMKDEYEVGKLYAYSAPDPKNPENRNPLPFAAVKDKIKDSLTERAKEGKQREAIEGLKASFHFSIKTDKLETLEPKEKD